MVSHDGQHIRTLRVAVIGGGITGLAAANRLIELAPDTQLTLFESGDRLGGVLRTERHDGYLVELSADNFITNVPWGVELCRRVGLRDQLLETRESQRRAFVVRGDRLLPVPVGFHLLSPSRIWPLFRSPLLSWPGKLRVLCEPFVRRRRENGDESLASFARRRLGSEAYERLVQPLVAGIYTADAEQLSMAAALPRFVEMERRWGSLVRGGRREIPAQADSSGSSGARYGLFVAPREGMSSLVDALAGRLPAGSVQCGSAVTHVYPGGNAWSLTVDGTTTEFDAVIFAVPAFAAASLLADTSAELAGDLQKISYAGSAIVALGYRLDQITRGWEGFGFVVPGIERHEILAASYSSAKFDGRAPGGRVLIRVFLGGADRPDQLELDDATLVQRASRDLGELLGIKGPPELTRVVRWPSSMPQYHVGHVELVDRIEKLAGQWPTLALAGNAYHGVGVPNCIHSGEQAAERMLAALGARGAG
ncbi:MAG TPA: protoporphyrinogen oxidase [Pirellulales bacterium]|jgi:oxygen-dependent protoporphyrinogen oxidase|nr:protoporphyrinogen oxidase [Pirellulales bacterium]